MMSCSTSRTSPESVPSWMSDLISSSVTFDVLSPMHSNFTIADVEKDRSHTIGNVNTDSSFIGPATILAMASARPRPIRLGTSSPTTIDR